MFIKLLLAVQASLQLQGPERVLPVDFTQIRGVRELPDGRVLISDRLDRGVVVADFLRGSIAQIGRTGSGPEEYRVPTGLSPMPGDSTLLADEGNQRLAVIGPDLKIKRTFNLMIPGIGVPLGARNVDCQGRFLLQIPAWVMDTPLLDDSVLVVRFDPRTQRADTLARIKGYTPRKNTMKPGIPYVLFAAQDVWSITPDGRLGVVRLATTTSIGAKPTDRRRPAPGFHSSGAPSRWPTASPRSGASWSRRTPAAVTGLVD